MKRVMNSLWAILFAMTLMSGSHLSAQDESIAAPAEAASGQDVSGESGDDESGHNESGHNEGDHDESGHDEADHGSGHGEIHLENDPTHGNIDPKTWELLDFRGDMALFSAIVFGLLLAGLYFSAWQPVMDGLQKREDTIADNIAKAEQAAEDAESKLAEYEAKLATASEEAATIVAEARKDAESAGQKLLTAAQEEAERLKERATADIETAKRVALGELADQSTEVAMAVAQRVVGREVKADDHQSLIQEMLSKLPSKN